MTTFGRSPWKCRSAGEAPCADLDKKCTLGSLTLGKCATSSPKYQGEACWLNHPNQTNFKYAQISLTNLVHQGAGTSWCRALFGLVVYVFSGHPLPGFTPCMPVLLGRIFIVFADVVLACGRCTLHTADICWWCWRALGWLCVPWASFHPIVSMFQVVHDEPPQIPQTDWYPGRFCPGSTQRSASLAPCCSSTPSKTCWSTTSCRLRGRMPGWPGINGYLDVIRTLWYNMDLRYNLV